jgi:hypothetical protein
MKHKNILQRSLLSMIICAAVGASSSARRLEADWEHLSTAAGDLALPNTGREQTVALVLDIDRDGVNDFVIAERTTAPSVVWYKRHATGWSRFVIDSTPLFIEAGGHFFDIDRDGDLDIALGGDSRSNQVWWWENPYPSFSPATTWTRRLIKNSGSNQHHDSIFGDFDGDGIKEFVFWNQTALKLFRAQIPASPRTSGVWPLDTIFTTTARTIEGLAAGDVDGDGIDDIVGGGYWFRHVGSGVFSANPIDLTQKFSRAAVGQLIPGGRPEVVFVIGDSYPEFGVTGIGPLMWYEWKNNSWVPNSLGQIDHGHSVDIIDADGDGHG